MANPSNAAIGTWSGGRFMHFGKPLDDDALIELWRPDERISTVITADAYGGGAADSLLGRALEGIDRDEYCLIGAIGHDFYDGEREGSKGYPRFTDPRLRGPGDYARYLRRATELSLGRIGVDRFDVLLLHNPDRTGFRSPEVWAGMAALREAGLTRALGIAPGPANGFTLDLIECFERYGRLIDWAMIIYGPLEPWPGELVLSAAARHDVELITRVVDYGGIFGDDLFADTELGHHDHRGFRPAGWIERGREKLAALRPIAQAHRLTPLQLACQWNLAQAPVRCAAPTLIQETGPSAKPVAAKREELSSLPVCTLLSASELAAVRAIGDNTGSMKLKGAALDHDGDPMPDRWSLSGELSAVAQRWAIDPARDLVFRA